MVGWSIKEEGERRKATQFLSIDQARGHLTPDLLGHTQRQLSKRDKGAAYRSEQRSFNSRSALACSKENRGKFNRREILRKASWSHKDPSGQG